MKIYPLISDYKIAIEMSESFATRTTLVPYKVNGALYFATGGPAVVFKMQDSETNKCYALKCFVKHQQNRARNFSYIDEYIRNLRNNPYLVMCDYLPEELWVKDADFPVLIMPWIEGKTMTLLISELCAAKDLHSLSQLACKFDKMALWLLSQDMAHGDLKPDNIIVTPSGDLKLIDYDGMYVPSLAGNNALELGTAGYRHPKRSSGDFNALLDDFPILVLSLSLHALSIKPSLYNPSQGADVLLIRSEDYKNLLGAPCTSFFSSNADNAIIYARFSMLMYAVSQPLIKLEGLNGLLKETASQVEEFPFDIWDSVWEWVAKCDIKYSADRRELIKYSTNHYIEGEVFIEESTQIICNGAFTDCKGLTHISIPESVTTIGHGVFSGCTNLTHITIPESVTLIGHSVFSGCTSLTHVTIPESATSIGHGVFSGCTSLTHVTIPKSVTSIGDDVFSGCSGLTHITIPEFATSIGSDAFSGCTSLTHITIPESVTSIGTGAFSDCLSLSHVTILGCNFVFENGVLFNFNKSILINYLSSNTSDRYIIPESVIEIGSKAFSDCFSLTRLTIPKSVTTIGYSAFTGCFRLSYFSTSGCNFIFENGMLFNFNKSRIIYNTVEDDDYSQHNKFCSSRESDEMTWDAMTDGQYGDYSGGDIDYDLLGY